MAAMPWELEDGLKLVRALSEEVEKLGYQVTLGGSVLHKGRSENDVDLYFLPLERGKNSNADLLCMWLTKIWGERDIIPDWAPDPEQAARAEIIPDNVGIAGVGPEVAFPNNLADGNWVNRLQNAGIAGAAIRRGVNAQQARRAQPRGAANPDDNVLGQAFGEYIPPPKKATAFVGKWRFYRNSDKIDVFVVG